MSTALSAARAATRGKEKLQEALESYGAEAFSLSEWNEKKAASDAQGTWVWKAKQVNTNVTLRQRWQDQALLFDVQMEMEREMHTTLTSISDEKAAVNVSSGGNAKQPHHAAERQCAWRGQVAGKFYHCTNAPPKETQRQQPTLAEEQEQELARASARASGRDSAVVTPAAVFAPAASSLEQQIPPDDLPPQVKKSTPFCLWHVGFCINEEHPMEQNKLIEFPNALGLCTYCFVAQQHDHQPPKKLTVLQIPGVYPVDMQKFSKQAAHGASAQESKQQQVQLTADSVCCWHKPHQVDTYIWKCTNKVLGHPVLSGSFLPCCGYHAPRCIFEFQKKSHQQQQDNASKCPPIKAKNPFGLCRNHLEAHLSGWSRQDRNALVIVESEFQVPGLLECRKDKVFPPVKSHPLAPRPKKRTAVETILAKPVIDPSVDQQGNSDALLPVQLPSMQIRLPKFFQENSFGVLLVDVVVGIKNEVVDSYNEVKYLVVNSDFVQWVKSRGEPIHNLINNLVWRLNYARKANRYALRIQTNFRGKLARKRVLMIRHELQAMRRMKATRVIQRFIRGFLGRRQAFNLRKKLEEVVPIMQRIVRGGLARILYRRLRAAITIQRAYRAKRQRMLAWAIYEETQYMRMLQEEADENLRELKRKLAKFKRDRAARLLARRARKWKADKEKWRQEMQQRLQNYWSAVTIQRAWRRRLKYLELKRRYDAATTIQKRVRGWLTRHFWHDDPNILLITGFVNPVTGFEYVHAVILTQKNKSYSFPGRCLRRHYAAINLQRTFRGLLGRLIANERWLNMERRWQWIGLESGQQGRAKYGSLLPTCAYHPNAESHMIPRARWFRANRGFAYKYQDILDYMRDQEGLRAWSVTLDELQQQLHRQEEKKRQQIAVKAQAKQAAITAAEEYYSGLNGVHVEVALFPVGTQVSVDVIGSDGKRTIHPAVIKRAHHERGTFDVEYVPGLFSYRNVPVYYENNVKATRVQTHRNQATKTARLPLEQVLRHEIDHMAKELEILRANTHKMHLQQHDSEPTLETIDDIVDRLRDEQHDLLANRTRFVDFAFQNASLLETNWLQAVSHLRYGTSSTPKQHSPSKYKPVPMPERAQLVEELMSGLGFRHDPGANHKQPQESQEMCPLKSEYDLLEENHAAMESSRPVATARDDSSINELSSRVQTPQQVHRLIYQLKSLPHERSREQILHVVSRNVRTFVCGHPACGRCFSSYESTRLHQREAHLNQERLSRGDPFVDQHLHAYWPPQTPWNDERVSEERPFTPTVGCFACSFPNCKVEFWSKRDYERHMKTAHSNTEKPEEVPRNADSSVLWLGSYRICNNLYDRLNLGHIAKQITSCCLHTKYSEPTCSVCKRQASFPCLPCRLYSAVCLPDLIQINPEDHHHHQPSDSAGYTIFSLSDPEFCPGVNTCDLVVLDPKRPLEINTARCELPCESSEKHVVYVKLAVLIRDAKGSEWLIGQGYYPSRCRSQQSTSRDSSSRGSHRSPSRNSNSSSMELPADVHEVEFDDKQLVLASLKKVISAAMVFHCSERVFYQKHCGYRARLSPKPKQRHHQDEPGLNNEVFVSRYCRRAQTPTVTVDPQ